MECGDIAKSHSGESFVLERFVFSCFRFLPKKSVCLNCSFFLIETSSNPFLGIRLPLPCKWIGVVPERFLDSVCALFPLRSPTVYHGSVHHHCLTSSGTVVLTFSPAKLLCSWVLLSDDNFFVNTLDAGLRLLSLACLFLLVCLPLLIVAETLWQDVPYSCVFHKQYLFVSITKMIRNSTSTY